MPSRDEVLKDVLLRVRNLEIDNQALAKRVGELETGGGNPWAESFQVEDEFILGDEYAPEPSQIQQEVDHVPAKLLEASTHVTPHPLQLATGREDPAEDTPEVLEARRRIEQANEGDLQPKLHTKEVKVTPGPNDSLIITVPVPSKQQQFMRKGNANRVIANLPKLDHEVAMAAYVEGGPLWLHAFDRHHVVELPEDLRQQFVKDVALTAPEAAHELARDILKVTDPETQAAWANSNAEAQKQEAEFRNG